MGEHIFISYSHQDAKVMKNVKSSLEKEGLRVWVDLDRLKPGNRWSNNIANAIETANSVVVIQSPGSKRSEFVEREINYAEIHEKIIYPILAKGNQKQSQHILLASQQFVDVREDFDQGMKQLISELRSPLEISVAPQIPPSINYIDIVGKDATGLNDVVGKEYTTLDTLVTIHHPRFRPKDKETTGHYPLYDYKRRVVKFISDYEFDGIYLLVARNYTQITTDTKFAVQVVTGKFSASHHLTALQVKEPALAIYLKYYLESKPIYPFLSGSGAKYVRFSQLTKLRIPTHRYVSIEKQQLLQKD
jgi:hypothetical protein